jgi:hypothetical protein
MNRRSNAHLQTPEVRAKRARAIRRAFRLKRKAAAAAAGPALIPLDAVPGETAPLLEYASLPRRAGARRVKEQPPERERIDLAKGIVALLYRVLR